MTDAQHLEDTLLNLDGRGYKAYKDFRGQYQFPDFKLTLDYVQGDPFAAPSQLSVWVPMSVAGFPEHLYASLSREVALRDYLTRAFSRACRQLSQKRGTGKSGAIAVCRLGQEVLARTSAFVNPKGVEIRFTVGLPAQGRRILGRQAAEMLCDDIPELVDRALIYQNLDAAAIQQHVETVEDADWLRSQLPHNNLIAFVADGSILPRRSGVDARPLETNAVPFESPESLRVTFKRPNGGPISGMGIPRGITLIVGGGYHGKSTLLRAIELGVYNRIPGDGREFVVTDDAAVKIRAEDGRSVRGVDISAFINNLPQGQTTTAFSTENASGSTSQAANIIEAIEAGATALLIDEDTSATNFTIRDRRMQELIAKEHEPITPFVDRVRPLFDEQGISTILVMGGSGDYFEAADTAIAMTHYRPHNVTEQVKAIAAKYDTGRQTEASGGLGPLTPRYLLAEHLDPSRGKRAVKWQVRDEDEIVFGSDEIDVSAVEQLVDAGQLRAIAEAMVYLKQEYSGTDKTLRQILDEIEGAIASQGLDILSPFPVGNLAQFRRFELAAALNRLRQLQVKTP
jgi:predicted ABC-class ATPase